MNTAKKIKMIVAVSVAIVSLVGFVGMFCNDTSATFVITQTPKIRSTFEEDIIEYQQLESLIAVKNLQIDSLARIQSKTDADKLLKSNYELIKIEYEQQKNYIELDMRIGFCLISLVLILIYSALYIFAASYIVSNMQKRKRTGFVGRGFPSFFYISFFLLSQPCLLQAGLSETERTSLSLF